MTHDEAKDVRLLSRIAKINSAQKIISIPDYQVIGNKRWGRIDFLCHYCGYRVVRPSGQIITGTGTNDNKQSKKDKKEQRENISRKRKQDKFAKR